MRNLKELDKYRVPLLYELIGDETFGKFIIPSENGHFRYLVIASSNEGDWEHVSVSLLSLNDKTPLKRCPKWDEMCYIKDLFFEDEEEVIQFHPKKSQYVNIHPYVLHLWKPRQDSIVPPSH